MTSKGGGIPSDTEIERQLERMLASKCFQRSPNRSLVLDYIVRKALEDKEISEDIIGYALFPNYVADVSDDVRITARNLRRSLEEYYAQEGVDDLVRIELPRGPKYRPMFGYNPRSAARREYSRGLGMLSQLRLREAEQHFIKATESQSKYAEPCLGLATTYLLYPMCTSLIFNDQYKEPEWVDPQMWLPMSRGMVASARSVNRKWWRVFVMQAVVCCYRREWEKAQKAFDRALKLSAEDTRDDPWYVAYLVTIGAPDQAAAILEAGIKDSPSDVALLTEYGFVMYAMRRFGKAHSAFGDACTIDERYWPALIGYALWLLENMGEGEEAKAEALWRALTMASVKKALATYFPGLCVLMLARAGRVKEAGEELNSFVGSHRLDSLQTGLGYIGLGRLDEAVTCLHDAASLDHNPLLLWAHLWPVFDPLREHEGFRALLRKLKLPVIK